ncbi:MAG TPA: zinc dependent phospholipase C family protein [Candidatus Ozemobacteraceae bacterium]|nr:zinc dependent phospholipase C family protein [Candidatus Ozemobacteraceae bacterium]
MRRSTANRLLVLLVLGLFAAPLAAWGPMTHLTINARAYARSGIAAKSLSAVPKSLERLFIGGGPAPDIKFNAGEGFPREFHFDTAAILRMVDRAKSDPKFGLQDVAMALGWAGHLFAEVPSAHQAEGYPNAKITAPLPNAGYINHQLSELCVDILLYREEKELLRHQSLNLPVRLLEASMKAERERDPERSALTAERIKAAGNAFLPTVVGVRTIADYLLEERPELLEEMDAFYADRASHLERSVGDVAEMLGEHGFVPSGKAPGEGADKADRVRVPLTGSFKDKAKTLVYNALYNSLRSGATNDIFTLVACHTMDGIITNGLKEKFARLAGKAVGGSIADDKRHQQVVTRFVEGLLCRHDLTFPEIIAYATEGLERDSASVTKQHTQFSALGLAEDGRKRVTEADVTKAIAEVRRVEDVRRDWPWFWPFRPSTEKLSEARSKAARLMAWRIIDDATAAAPLKARAQALLKADRGVRSALWTSRSTSWFTPISKWKNRKALEQAEAAIAPEERLFAQIIDIRLRIGDGADASARVQTLLTQARSRLAELTSSLANARAGLERVSRLQIATRGKLKDEIKHIETLVTAERDHIAALELIQGLPADGETGTEPAATTADVMAAAALPQEPQAAIAMPEKYAGHSDQALRRLREDAYRRYTSLTQSGKTADAEALAALRELREIDQARQALAARSGSGR